MKICFIFPSYYTGADRLAKGKKAWAPLSTALLAAFVNKKHSINLVNDFVHPLSELYKKEFDVFFITVLGNAFDRASDLARTLKTKKNFIIICGKHLSETASALYTYTDSLVLGEAESFIGEIISDIEKKELKKQYGKPSLRSSLESLPIPRYDLIDRKKHGLFFPVEATMGCTRTCAYCYAQSSSKKDFRTRPAEQVIRDIVNIKRLGISNILFVDDNIFADREYALALFKRMIPLKIKWVSQAAYSVIKDEELMHAAAACGLIALTSCNENTRDVYWRYYKNFINVNTRNKKILIIKPKVFISVFEKACKQRKLDAKRIQDFFEKNNYPIAQKPKQADIIIFISCANIEKNTEASLAVVREFQKYNARLIIGGCATEIDLDKVQAIHGGEYFSTKTIDYLDRFFPGEENRFENTGDANCQYKEQGKNFYIRIAEGCSLKCSYCARATAIGRQKSKSAEQCLKEFKQGLDEGFKNFILTAKDTGSWGEDFTIKKEAKSNHEPASIASLLRQMISCGGGRDYSLTIDSLNPAGLHKNLLFLEEIFHSPVIRCVVVPVQSLNPRILKLMRRFSGIPAISQSISIIRRSSPKIKISSHIIIGFPSETIEELYETLSLWEELPFDDGKFFSFNLKQGTSAEKLKSRLSESEIQQRIKLAYKYFKERGYACFVHEDGYFFVTKKGKR